MNFKLKRGIIPPKNLFPPSYSYVQDDKLKTATACIWYYFFMMKILTKRLNSYEIPQKIISVKFDENYAS